MCLLVSTLYFQRDCHFSHLSFFDDCTSENVRDKMIFDF